MSAATIKPDLFALVRPLFEPGYLNPQDAPGCVPLRRRPNPVRKLRPELNRVYERIPNEMRRAFRECGRGLSPWPLFVCGPAGCGKTRGTLFLCDYVAGDVRWRDAGELAAEYADLKCGRMPANCRSDVPMPLSEYCREWREWFALAVIDEIGARKDVSDTAYEALKLVLDCREGQPLVLLSNLDLDGIAALYDDRVASRTAAGTVLMLDGDDQRIEKPPEESLKVGGMAPGPRLTRVNI